MPQGSGLAAQLAYTPETTWGTTPVSPTWRAIEHVEESLSQDKGTYNGQGLRAGRHHRRGSRRAVTRRSSSGQVTHEVPNKGFGLLLQHMLDSNATAVQQASTTAYLQTHETVAGQLNGKGLTIQKGVPRASGTVDPYTYRGAKVTRWELSMSNDGVLMCELNFDAREEDRTLALATLSYPTGTRLFSFTGAALTAGGSALANVTNLTLRQEISRADERHFFGGSGLKSEQVEDDYRETTGTLEVEYGGTDLYDAFRDDTAVELVATFTGANITGAYDEEIAITLRDVRYNGETPQVGGPDIISQTVPFEAFDPDTGSAPLTITYQSTDTAL